MHRHFEETPSLATFPAIYPFFALDRLWVKPRALLKRMEVHSSPLARIASDHLPLKAELNLSCGSSDAAAVLRAWAYEQSGPRGSPP
jgi:endonuclease/exonuclease/phosphatase family metal-dependent hydrolase